MADFSKQWCDLNDPEMPHDFDIEEIASTLKIGYYKSFICEGFGFLAIGKDNDDNITLFFDHENKNPKHRGWVDYVEFMHEQKTRQL